jgi:ribose transport system ATP-binding protein
LKWRNQQAIPGVVALDGVSLEVFEGEIVALIGENGAGKSTLMKILGGVTKPDSGKITLSGQTTPINSPLEASRLGIEFIHQELSVLDNSTWRPTFFSGVSPPSAARLASSS